MLHSVMRASRLLPRTAALQSLLLFAPTLPHPCRRRTSSSARANQAARRVALGAVLSPASLYLSRRRVRRRSLLSIFFQLCAFSSSLSPSSLAFSIQLCSRSNSHVPRRHGSVPTCVDSRLAQGGSAPTPALPWISVVVSIRVRDSGSTSVGVERLLLPRGLA